jgi:hypothetical protein
MTGPASSNTTKPVHELSGPNGSIVRRYRRELLAIARQHGARNLRVFGSTARGQARPDSDVDLLVATAEIVFPTSRRRSKSIEAHVGGSEGAGCRRRGEPSVSARGWGRCLSQLWIGLFCWVVAPVGLGWVADGESLWSQVCGSPVPGSPGPNGAGGSITRGVAYVHRLPEKIVSQ